MFFVLKKEKNTVSSLPRALFTLALTSTLQSRHLKLNFFNHQGQNRITILPILQGLFHQIERITLIKI